MIIYPDNQNPAYRWGTGRIGGVVINKVRPGGSINVRTRYSESSRLYREACAIGLPCSRPWEDLGRHVTYQPANQPENPNLYRQFWILSRGTYLVRYWTGTMWFHWQDERKRFAFNYYDEPIWWGTTFSCNELGWWGPFDPGQSDYGSEENMISALQRVDHKPWFLLNNPLGQATLEMNCNVSQEPYRSHYNLGITWAICRLPFD